MNELMIPEKQGNLTVINDGDMFFNPVMFEHAQRVAKVFTQSSMVPQQFQGDKNIGNVMIAMNYAKRVDADIFMVLQNMYVIHGKPGIETKLAIALLNNSGRFSNLKYKYDDNKTSCIAYATDLKTNEMCEGVSVSIEMAQKEGWAGKQGSKWKTMPELMLMYRSAIFFIRAYAPDVLLGMRSKEELIDITPRQEISTNQESTMKTDDLGEVLKSNGNIPKKTTNDVIKPETPPKTTESTIEPPKETPKELPPKEEAETVPSAWLLQSYKNMRAGQFDPSKPATDWTGFAKHVFENRGTWAALKPAYMDAAVKKWDVVYPGTPFILDADGDLTLPIPDKVENGNIGDEGNSEPPPMEGTITQQDVLNMRESVAKAKVCYPDTFDAAASALIGDGVIRHSKIESLAYNECDALMEEMTKTIESSD